MRKHYLSIAMIATMALASCGTENEDVQVLPADGDKTVETPATDNKEQITFKAVYFNGDYGFSKTAIENRTSLVFTANDDIKVFDGTESSIFKGDITDGTSATCNFTGTANPADIYYAVYPSSASLNESSASAEIPATQTAEAGTFDKNAHVMVASANGTNKEFKFKTANAFIRFTAPRNLKSVVMTGNNGEAIAGNTTISGYSGIAVSGASATSITLSGTMEKGKEYYISYAPAKFENGITLTLTDETDKQGIYKTNGFESNPNQVNNIKAEKLIMAFYPGYSLCEDADKLSDYLEKFQGDVAEVVLTDYDCDKVMYALDDNYSIRVKLVLPESVTEMEERAFWRVENLVSIEMTGVTTIGTGAFEGCTSLEQITFPNVTTIGAGAFYRCTSLEQITIPANVTTIGTGAFLGCTSLEQITIPANVTKLGDWVFDDCKNLKSITILGNPEISDAKHESPNPELIPPMFSDYESCPDGTVINVSEASYNRYTNYWDFWNSKSNITVNVLP